MTIQDRSGSNFDFASLNGMPYQQWAHGVKRYVFTTDVNILDDPRNGDAFQVNDSRYAVINPFACRVNTYFFNNAIYESVIIEESKEGGLYCLGEGTDDTFVKVLEVIFIYDRTVFESRKPNYGNMELVNFVKTYSTIYWQE